MAKTYDISPTSGDTERDGVNAHVAKNPDQIRKTQVIKNIKDLDKKGKYVDAQKLYKKEFK